MNYDDANILSVIVALQKGQTSRPPFALCADRNKPSREHSNCVKWPCLVAMFRAACPANSGLAIRMIPSWHHYRLLFWQLIFPCTALRESEAAARSDASAGQCKHDAESSVFSLCATEWGAKRQHSEKTRRRRTVPCQKG